MAGNKQEFVKMVNFLIMETSPEQSFPEGYAYWESHFKNEEKPMLTENGKKILECMKELETKESSKYIAEKLGIPSRSVAGALVKLVKDGFVNKEKCEDAPALYYLTELGKNI